MRERKIGKKNSSETQPLGNTIKDDFWYLLCYTISKICSGGNYAKVIEHWCY